jgi:hypothetical protein
MGNSAKYKVNTRIYYNGSIYKIDTVCLNGYEVHCVDNYTEPEDCATYISFNAHDRMTEYKYSSSELKPYDKVLVRDDKEDYWIPTFFGFVNYDHPARYVCSNGWRYRCCIPYNEDTAYLLGTKEEYDGYYKTW